MRIDYWAKFEDNCYYHIYNRGINGTNLFVREENFYFFLNRWKKYLVPYFDVLAYCLMPNHFHFLVRVKPYNDSMLDEIKRDYTQRSQKFVNGLVTYNEYLEDQFKRLFSSYALAINKQEGRHGSLLEKRFKRVLVKTDFKLSYLLVYIHHNPIHHRFSRDYRQWNFSSYNTYFSDDKTLLAKEEVLHWFDQSDLTNGKKLFQEHHEQFRLNRQMSGYHLEMD
ncbi:MAG: hypothetical protein IPL46_05255 [Saprospiraceae bacterium]|nr:hypothetical protein [Saprospiraceae bacterium]